MKMSYLCIFVISLILGHNVDKSSKINDYQLQTNAKTQNKYLKDKTLFAPFNLTYAHKIDSLQRIIDTKDSELVKLQKDEESLFEKYYFPIITSIIGFLLGLVTVRISRYWESRDKNNDSRVTIANYFIDSHQELIEMIDLLNKNNQREKVSYPETLNQLEKTYNDAKTVINNVRKLKRWFIISSNYIKLSRYFSEYSKSNIGKAYESMKKDEALMRIINEEILISECIKRLVDIIKGNK